MTELQLVTLAITLLAIFGAMYGNRKAVEDMRDVLRAEFKGELRTATNEIHLILQRIENKLSNNAVNASHP